MMPRAMLSTLVRLWFGGSNPWCTFRGFMGKMVACVGCRGQRMEGVFSKWPTIYYAVSPSCLKVFIPLINLVCNSANICILSLQSHFLQYDIHRQSVAFKGSIRIEKIPPRHFPLHVQRLQKHPHPSHYNRSSSGLNRSTIDHQCQSEYLRHPRTCLHGTCLERPQPSDIQCHEPKASRKHC